MFNKLLFIVLYLIIVLLKLEFLYMYNEYKCIKVLLYLFVYYIYEISNKIRFFFLYSLLVVDYIINIYFGKFRL